MLVFESRLQFFYPLLKITTENNFNTSFSLYKMCKCTWRNVNKTFLRQIL